MALGWAVCRERWRSPGVFEDFALDFRLQTLGLYLRPMRIIRSGLPCSVWRRSGWQSQIHPHRFRAKHGLHHAGHLSLVMITRLVPGWAAGEDRGQHLRQTLPNSDRMRLLRTLATLPAKRGLVEKRAGGCRVRPTMMRCIRKTARSSDLPYGRNPLPPLWKAHRGHPFRGVATRRRPNFTCSTAVAIFAGTRLFSTSRRSQPEWPRLNSVRIRGRSDVPGNRRLPMSSRNISERRLRIRR